MHQYKSEHRVINKNLTLQENSRNKIDSDSITEYWHLIVHMVYIRDFTMYVSTYYTSWLMKESLCMQYIKCIRMLITPYVCTIYCTYSPLFYKCNIYQYDMLNKIIQNSQNFIQEQNYYVKNNVSRSKLIACSIKWFLYIQTLSTMYILYRINHDEI